MKLLIVGLDGVDHRLVKHWGLWQGPLSEVQPSECCCTPVEWTSMATGLRPAQHGITRVAHPDGRSWAHDDLEKRRGIWWSIYERLGYRAGIVGWPVLTNPAHKVRGWMVGGYSVIPQTVWPEEYAQVEGVKSHYDEHSWQAESGVPPLFVYPPDAPPPTQADLDERAESLQRMAWRNLERAFGTTLDLCRHDPVDIAAVYTHTTDSSGHYLCSPRYQEKLRLVYKHAFVLFDQLLSELQPEAWLLLSDHGMRQFLPWVDDVGAADMSPNHEGEVLGQRAIRMRDGRVQYAGACHPRGPMAPFGIAASSGRLQSRLRPWDVYDVILRLGMTVEDRLRSFGYD